MRCVLILLLMARAAQGQITAGGDLSGSLPAPTVAKIQGRAVDTGAPSDKQVYVWIAGTSKWTASFIDWANLTSKPTFASTNTANAVVQRDANGDFAARNITAAILYGTNSAQIKSGTGYGAVSLWSGDTSGSGYLAWHNTSGVRLAYFGYDTGDTLTLSLEQATKFTINKTVENTSGGYKFPDATTQTTAYKADGQINFVYGGSSSVNIDATTVNNVWRAHAYYATITEVACWTDAGTVTLAVKDSAGNQVTNSTLACSSTGASTTSMNSTYSLIGSGEGLGFTTSSVSGVKNLSVSIKYTRSYP